MKSFLERADLCLVSWFWKDRYPDVQKTHAEHLHCGGRLCTQWGLQNQFNMLPNHHPVQVLSGDSTPPQVMEQYRRLSGKVCT